MIETAWTQSKQQLYPSVFYRLKTIPHWFYYGSTPHSIRPSTPPSTCDSVSFSVDIASNLDVSHYYDLSIVIITTIIISTTPFDLSFSPKPTSISG